MFLRMQHRRVAFVFPRYNLRGDTISKEGFVEALQESKRAHVQPLLAGHDGTVQGICSVLKPLFRSPTPPTGLYVSYPQDVLTVLSYLAQLHVRVPHDVSLLSRHDDPFLHHLTPSIAAYEFGVSHYAARLAQMAIRTSRLGSGPARHALAMGVFRKGDSLAPPPKINQ
jgi:DNA-binding LacI/PurR family transcriptional regulator